MKWLRDWWRGYTDADARSVFQKLGGPSRPGSIIEMSLAERRAMLDNLIHYPPGIPQFAKMSAATITLIDRPDGGTDIRLASSKDEGPSTRIAASLVQWLEKVAKDDRPVAPQPPPGTSRIS